MDKINIVTEIKKSKKYSRICPRLLERVCAEESAKYKKNREKIKAVKNRLHTIYGAFFSENSVKLAESLINDRDENSPVSEISEKLMKLNTSSNERMSFIDDMYKFVFGTISTGPHKDVNTILDIGCGFNPFSLPHMLKCEPTPDIKSYYAFDIDSKLAEITNKYFGLFGLPQYAGCMDIISETPPQTADIAFLFKIIPTIENCKKGRGFEIINSLNSTYEVISFPTKTLCGNDKGMEENYAAFFERNLDYAKFSIAGKNIFKNELVYVLFRKTLF